MSHQHISTLFLILVGSLVHAQPLLDHHDPSHQNVRLAWAPDADGGVDGDDWKAFEVAYASAIYPLDQLIISYAHHNYDQKHANSLLLSIEEHFPLSERMVPYGVAGIGYMWTNFADEVPGSDDGLLLKIGTGLLFKLSEPFHLFAEIAYLTSDRDIWLDGRNATTSQNWQGLLGFRFNY